MAGMQVQPFQLGFHLSGVLVALLTIYTITYKMNIEQLLEQATRQTGDIDILHYTNLVLTEACRLIKETKITGAYTSFDANVAITQRAECFKSVYNQIVENIENAST
jgi:hypothetical protein